MPESQPAARQNASKRKPKHPPLPKLYTVDETAAALSVSRTRIYRLMREGQLPYLVIGAVRKIAQHDLWVYLRKARRRGETAHTLGRVAKAPDDEQDEPARDPRQPELPHIDAPGRDSFEEWPSDEAEP